MTYHACAKAACKANQSTLLATDMHITENLVVHVRHKQTPDTRCGLELIGQWLFRSRSGRPHVYQRVHNCGLVLGQKISSVIRFNPEPKVMKGCSFAVDCRPSFCRSLMHWSMACRGLTVVSPGLSRASESDEPSQPQ